MGCHQRDQRLTATTIEYRWRKTHLVNSQEKGSRPCFTNLIHYLFDLAFCAQAHNSFIYFAQDIFAQAYVLCVDFHNGPIFRNVGIFYFKNPQFRHFFPNIRKRHINCPNSVHNCVYFSEFENNQHYKSTGLDKSCPKIRSFTSFEACTLPKLSHICAPFKSQQIIIIIIIRIAHGCKTFMYSEKILQSKNTRPGHD